MQVNKSEFNEQLIIRLLLELHHFIEDDALPFGKEKAADHADHWGQILRTVLVVFISKLCKVNFSFLSFELGWIKHFSIDNLRLNTIMRYFCQKI